MSTYLSEPGTRLAGRYRLEDQIGGGSGWALWKAIDEILARAVTVLVFAGGFPRIREAVTAARAASRLTDSRLSQVFDVDDSGDGAYIVMEWVAGRSLGDMLADGPLEAARAVALVTEAAQALAVAHEAGLAHLRLGPGSLRWTPGGGVKITGLGIDAVLAGPEPPAADGAACDDPALADTRGLAGLLYAGLTGYWPGGASGTGEAEAPDGILHGAAALPPAPMRDGIPCSPRQVSAAVPVSIDSVVCRALFQRQSRSGSAITTPAALADALARLAPPGGLAGSLPPPAAAESPLPAWRGAPAAPLAGGGPAGLPPSASAGPGASRAGRPADADGPGGRHGTRGRAGNVPARALIGAVVVLVLAAAGATAWTLGRMPARPPAHRAHHSGQGRPSTAANVMLTPVSAQGFDNGDAAKYAIDGNPSTDWHTDYYLGNPVFGNLKKGTGLLLDMGRPVRLSQVTIQFGPVCCAHVHIGIGGASAAAALNGPGAEVASPQGFTTVASTTHAAGTDTFHVSSTARGQYVLVWFTSLPPLQGSPGKYEAQIYNIVLRGPGRRGSGDRAHGRRR